MTTIGQSGSLGSDWNIHNNRRMAAEKRYKNDIDMYTYGTMGGVDTDQFLKNLADDISLSPKNTDGGNLLKLSWANSLYTESSPDDRVFLDTESDDDTVFANLNMSKFDGTYEIMDEKKWSENLNFDWSKGKPYDIFDINLNTVDFFNYTGNGLGDGVQNKVTAQIRNSGQNYTNDKWGFNSVTYQEIDKSKIHLDPTADTSEDDAETQLANQSWSYIKEHKDQWLTPAMKQVLSNYKEGTPEYESRLITYAQEALGI